MVNVRVTREDSFDFDVSESVNKVTSQDGAIVKDILVAGVGFILTTQYTYEGIPAWPN
jgi:hypothetical protein